MAKEKGAKKKKKREKGMRAGDPSCHCPAFQSEGEGRLKKDDPEPKNRMLKAKKKK